MFEKNLTKGLLLGITGFIYWIFLLLPIGRSKIFIFTMNVFVMLLWAYFNYTTCLSNSRYSILSRFIQLYMIPFFILIIGLLGKYFNLIILSSVFSIYFTPFIDISILVLKTTSNSINYLFAPFVSMIIISLLTFITYRMKTKS